jgi:hypothetical protein
MNDNNGGNVAEGLEAILYVPKIVTETVATSPPNRARKTIGVGEEVKLTLLPEGLSGVLWNVTEGGGQVSGYTGDTITFTAPDRASDITLTVDTDAGTMGSVTFHVIEPTGVLMENETLQYASSGPDWIAIKYWANIYLTPSTVNFYNASVHEGPSRVYTNGYFTLYDHRMRPHEGNGPHPMSEEVVDGKGTLCMNADEITGVADIIGSHISGDLYWIMNWSFSVGTGQKKEIEGVRIRQNNHIEFPGGTATLTVTKDRSGYSTVFGTNVGIPVNP